MQTVVLPGFGSAGDLTVPSQDGVTFDPIRDLPLATQSELEDICTVADAEFLELHGDGGPNVNNPIYPGMVVRALAGADTPSGRKGFAVQDDGLALIQDGWIKYGPIWGAYDFCTDELLSMLRSLGIPYNTVKFNPQTYIADWSGPFQLGFPELEDRHEAFIKCFYASMTGRGKQFSFRRTEEHS
jgi:hypothetical protein